MILLTAIAVLLFIDLLFFVNDKYVVSFFGLVAIVAGAWYYIPEVTAFVATHGIFELVMWYIAAGIVVATAKWFIANVSLWLKLRNSRADFKKSNPNVLDEPVHVRQSRFAKFWNAEYGRHGNSLTPHVDHCKPEDFENRPNKLVDALTLRAKEHIERITFWVLQWPIVVVATALEDLIVNVGKNVARFFDYAFTQFSRRIIESTVKDL